MEKPRRGGRRREDVISMRFILSISIKTNYTQKGMESKSKLGESCCKGVQEEGEFYVWPRQNRSAYVFK